MGMGILTVRDIFLRRVGLVHSPAFTVSLLFVLLDAKNGMFTQARSLEWLRRSRRLCGFNRAFSSGRHPHADSCSRQAISVRGQAVVPASTGGVAGDGSRDLTLDNPKCSGIPYIHSDA